MKCSARLTANPLPPIQVVTAEISRRSSGTTTCRSDDLTTTKIRTRTTWVWTSWDGGRTYGGGSQAGPGAPFDPFDPFAPFRRAEPEPTREEALAAAARDLRREALVIAGKAALLAVMTIGGAVSSGLFLYVAVSFVYGLWKRLGTCLFGFLVPAMVVLALLSLFVAPRGGAVTVGLALVFMIAAAFDVANLRTRFNAWRAARRRAR